MVKKIVTFSLFFCDNKSSVALRLWLGSSILQVGGQKCGIAM